MQLRRIEGMRSTLTRLAFTLAKMVSASPRLRAE
jgi:hypothetical protein